MEGKQNFHLFSLAAPERQKLLLRFLRRSFNDSRAEDFEPWVVEHNWAEQPYARGAYTGFLPPGVLSMPAYWEAFRNPEKAPNVFVAGADYHPGFGNGYIEGAIRSGQAAADAIRQRLAPARPGPSARDISLV